MDSAIMILSGQKENVKAGELCKRFEHKVPSGADFFCPYCGQSVVPCSFGRGSVYAPHFKHKKNNPKARECDLYQSSGDSVAGIKSPLPVFLRPSQLDPQNFRMELGFRRPCEAIMRGLEAAGAEIVVESRRFPVRGSAFEHGMMKVDLAFPTTHLTGSVSYGRLPGSYEGVWTKPEDAEGVMFFSIAGDGTTGSRVRRGDALITGKEYYAVCDGSDFAAVRRQAPSFRAVGSCGRSLNVGRFFIEKSMIESSMTVDFFERKGFELVLSDPTPSVVWPPRLTSGGGSMPLFERSRPLVCVRDDSLPEGSPFVARAFGVRGETFFEYPSSTSGEGVLFAYLDPASHHRSVTSRRWGFASVELLPASTAPAGLEPTHLPLAPHYLVRLVGDETFEERRPKDGSWGSVAPEAEKVSKCGLRIIRKLAHPRWQAGQMGPEGLYVVFHVASSVLKSRPNAGGRVADDWRPATWKVASSRKEGRPSAAEEHRPKTMLKAATRKRAIS